MIPYRLTDVEAQPFAEVIRRLRPAYPMREIAERTGVARYTLTEIAMGHRTFIWAITADKLRRQLPEMCDQ